MPFLLTEFAHAMGSGPGGLAEYLQLCEEYPRVQGGWVWEWMDQGLRSSDAQGREFFAYGGDFGEGLHDGNFIFGGLGVSGRAASSGVPEDGKVIAPARIGPGAQAGTLVVENHYDVVDLSHLAFVWSLAREGVEVAQGALPTPQVAAGERAVVPLPALDAGGEGELWLTVQAVLAEGTGWAPAAPVVPGGPIQ